ncbi:metal-binding protein [Aliidongia dinghuensis]|uniref:Metal-binding protein n=1 Tax=Aliidongia dinghuensis TaxID=1867774 RepID=A0A8J2YXE7_9PROT|nr:DUF177 domain-containing protein [Aliidongia dinghuensis]GGF28482.1 metal-binding protein [Aliidongia dinghuensis]
MPAADHPPSSPESAPEFSHLVSTARLGTKSATYRLAANAAERAALAQRFDLISLDRFEATVTLKREAGEAIRLEGEIAADLVQACVVTNEPVPGRVVDRFTLIYRADIDEATADQMALDNPEDEIIEPLIGDSIDIGEAVAQQLSVAMDPYPRSVGAQSSVPSAEAMDEDDEPGASTGRRNPFDVLAALKKQS